MLLEKPSYPCIFEEDLEEGVCIEDEFVLILRGKYPGREIKKGRVGEKTFDISVEMDGYTVLYEVKADFKSSSTGNVAIEYRYKQKPSGIAVTLADFWVQLSGNTYYVFDTQALKEELRLNWQYYKKVAGGDNRQSHLVLIPIKRVLNFHFVELVPVHHI